MFRRLCVGLMLACAVSGVLADELTAEKFADIRRLMDVTGSAGIAKQFAAVSSQQIFQNLKARNPQIPDRTRAVLERELNALFSEKMIAPGGLMDQMVPIYGKYFTHDEIKELLAFYQTPIGKKSVLVLPKVMAEGMESGKSWGASLAPELERRVTAALRREGIVPPEK